MQTKFRGCRRYSYWCWRHFVAGFASFHSFAAKSLMRAGPADQAHAPQITK